MSLKITQLIQQNYVCAKVLFAKETKIKKKLTKMMT